MKTAGRLYWAFWCTTTMLAGILAGYMISHSIMLARFFNWYVASGNRELIRRTFAVFREESRAYVVYDTPLYLHLISGIVFVALAFALRRERLLAAIGGLSTLLTGAIFMTTDFDEIEDAVVTGTADKATEAFFLAWNVPMHASFAVIYTISLFLLLLVPLRARRA